MEYERAVGLILFFMLLKHAKTHEQALFDGKLLFLSIYLVLLPIDYIHIGNNKII